MEYFDKQLLDNKTIESIKEQLDSYEIIRWDTAIKKEYRDYCKEVMLELLEYYWDRQEMEAKQKAKQEARQKEILTAEDLPF